MAMALYKKSQFFYHFYKMVNFFIYKLKVFINFNNNKKNYRLKNKYKKDINKQFNIKLTKVL